MNKTYLIAALLMTTALTLLPSASASPPTCAIEHPDDHALIGLVTCNMESVTDVVEGCTQNQLYIWWDDAGIKWSWYGCPLS